MNKYNTSYTNLNFMIANVGLDNTTLHQPICNNDNQTKIQNKYLLGIKNAYHKLDKHKLFHNS